MLLRSGKTEALSDTLQIAEKRIELIKNACQNITKKLSSTLTSQSHGLGHDAPGREKRLVSKIFALILLNRFTLVVNYTYKTV